MESCTLDPNTADNEASVEFYNLMKTILHTYVKSSNNPPMEKNSMLTLANVGLTIVNINEKKRYIGDVLVNLIEGELTSANERSIYCPFTGDLLGNQLEDLMNAPKHNKTEPWSVFDENRAMFSIKDQTTSSDDNKPDNVMSSTNTNTKQNASNIPNQQPKNIEQLKMNFAVNIMNMVTIKELKTNITKLQTIYPGNPELDGINIDQLLDFFSKYNNSLAKKLYAILPLWNEDQNVKSQNVYGKLIGLKQDINARNIVIKDDIADNIERKKPEEIMKLRRERDVNEKILLVIIDRVIEHENGKMRRGGTRRKRKYKKRGTKKKSRR